MMNNGFENQINKLNQNKVYPFHMPGHKRNMESVVNQYAIDITEIDGYDNLHNPEGMIKELQEYISELYSSEKSYVLVNGSTCGILSAISAVTSYGDTILMARNSHKAAFNAVLLRGLNVEYIYPEYIDDIGINGSISVKDIRNKLEENEGKYKAVYITSPTYEGIVSDIEQIVGIVHKYNIPLIVDEAHGAHFGLSDYFPQTSLRLGADIVIQSIHKTLTGMTQTAVLHIKGSLINRDKLEYFLRVYQSSSPSYVLMSSVDRCMSHINKKLFEIYYNNIKHFTEACKKLRYVNIYSPDVDKRKIFDFDCGKILIYSKYNYINGREIYDYLRTEHNLQLEMASGKYAIAMTSYMDTKEGFERLLMALLELDICIATKISDGAVKSKGIEIKFGQQKNETVFNMANAFEMDKLWMCIEEKVNVYSVLEKVESENAGLVSADFIDIYPPGIPFIVPGEKLTKDVIYDIIKYMEHGFNVNGIIEIDGKKCIRVCRF